MAVISFKCPNCDGELIFDPSTQKYKCEYCFSLFSQEELDAMKPAQTTEPQNADAAGAGKASGKPEDKKQSQPGNNSDGEKKPRRQAFKARQKRTPRRQKEQKGTCHSPVRDRGACDHCGAFCVRRLRRTAHVPQSRARRWGTGGVGVHERRRGCKLRWRCQRQHEQRGHLYIKGQKRRQGSSGVAYSA